MQCVFQPYEGDKPYIFVSYSHKDGERVAPILNRMYQEGFRIWYDEGIDWGTEWPAEIEKHLLGSAAFLAFHSVSSVESVNCRQEITYAIQHKKGILPIYLEQVTLKDGLEMQMTLYQAIHYWQYQDQEKFFARLLRAQAIQLCRDSENGIPAEASGEDYAPATEQRVPVSVPGISSDNKPMLMIGLGGTGARCVDAVKAKMAQMLEDSGHRVRFLAVDTDYHDLQGLTHLEGEERFFIRTPNLMMNPMDLADQIWNEELADRLARCVSIELSCMNYRGEIPEVYVISGAGGRTGAGLFLKMPGLQARLGRSVRFSGVLFQPELFRGIDLDRMDAMKRIRNHLMRSMEQGNEREGGVDGYQRCSMVEQFRNLSLNEAIFQTAEILAREALEPQLINCMEPAGFWKLDQEGGVPISRMGIARADWNPDRIRRMFGQRLIHHVGVGGPGADRVDFLGKNSYPDLQQMDSQVKQMLAPVEQLVRRMGDMNDSYLQNLEAMSHTEAVRYLTSGGEQELMRLQDRMIQWVMSTSGLEQQADQIRQLLDGFRNKVWQIVERYGLYYFLHLYHGVYRKENGSLGYDGCGMKQRLYELMENRWDHSRIEWANGCYQNAQRELLDINGLHRILYAYRLRGAWTDAFRNLGHARMIEARAQVLLGKGKMLDREFVEKADQLAADVDRFAWILDGLCEESCGWDDVYGAGDLVEPERIDPQMTEVIQEEIRRIIASVDPAKARGLLLRDWIAHSSRWTSAPEEAVFAWMDETVSTPAFDLVWFFRERMKQGGGLGDTAYLLLHTMVDWSAIPPRRMPGVVRETAYLLIPDSLSTNEPVICNALVNAAQNLGMYVQVIFSRTPPLCMIRGEVHPVPVRP